MSHNEIAARDFSRKTLNTMTRKGITVAGATFVPGADGSFANGERAYALVSNGCQYLRTFLQTLAIVEGKATL